MRSRSGGGRSAVSDSAVNHAFAVTVSAVDITALYLAAGIMAVLLWASPPGIAAGGDDLRRMWRIAGVCALVLAADTVVILLQRSQVLSGGPYGRLWPLLPQVLGQTHFGHEWLIRIGAVGALAAGWWRLRPAPRPAGAAWMLGLLVLLAFTRSATGHSADQGDWTTPEVADWLHILAGMLWAGSVVAGALLWLRRPLAGRGAAFAGFAGALSRLATAGLAGVVMTGIYSAWLKLAGASDLWTTAYGRHLTWKIALVGVIAALGTANRFLYLRRLTPAPGAGGTPAVPMRRFLVNLYIEAAVAVAVFIAAAVLINTQPPHMPMGGMAM